MLSSRVIKAPASIPEAGLFPFRLIRAVGESWRLLGQQHIDLVLGMGGFPSIPLGLAAILRRRPLFLHEGNAVIGRANRILQFRCRRLMLSLPLESPQTAKAPTTTTGFPLRPELLAANPGTGEKKEDSTVARTKLGLAPNLPTMLVFGGSQGADFLNRLVLAFCQLEESKTFSDHFQIIHFTGSPEAAHELQSTCRQAGITAFVDAWSDRMEDAYQAADLVICRAGGATIAEAAWFQKSTVLIPLPAAMEDHQTANAEVLSRQNAALHWPQHETTPERLLLALKSRIAEPELWREREQNLAGLAAPEAARRAVETIVEDCGI